MPHHVVYRSTGGSASSMTSRRMSPLSTSVSVRVPSASSNMTVNDGGLGAPPGAVLGAAPSAATRTLQARLAAAVAVHCALSTQGWDDGCVAASA